MSKNTTSDCNMNSKVCSIQRHSNQINLDKQRDNRLTLKYYYDPLCGWCYGFSPVIDKIHEIYSHKFRIEVVCGGLFLGQRVGKINDVAPHIKQGAYKSVEMRTGVRFGEAFLDIVFGEGDMILNSFPLIKALCIVKEENPNKELSFASQLLSAVYNDGVHPSNLHAIAELAEKIGCTKSKFIEKMAMHEYEEKALNQIKKFHSSQFSAMPALVLENDGKEYPITRGYNTLEPIISNLDAVLQQK